jgi:plastocyanin
MRKHWFHSIGLGGLSAIGLMLGLQQAASAADNLKIEIVRQAGKFVFAPVDVTIAAGQSVEWFSQPPTTNAPHQLVGDPPFKPTAEFTPPKTATQTFATPGVMKYHCAIHPSMKGTITVK